VPGNWPALFGKGPTEKARVTGTSPAAYFTLKASEGSQGPSLSQLTNAETREERWDDEVRYTFTRRIGTKGADHADIVTILRQVPAKQLGIFDVATLLVDAAGELDAEAAAARQPEINLAIAEAEIYARATRSAVEALRRIPQR
jgi:hypothetical protein